jgi:diguanylate cyclase (GGDEF)-like protein/PAS domain S-box-containing protein
MRRQLAAAEARAITAEVISGTGSATWDVRAGRLSWSANLYRIHGVDTSRFVPTADAVMELIHEEDRSRVTEAVGQAIATGGQFAMSYRIVIPDGSVRDLDWRGQVERDPRGFLARLDGVVRDVTDQRRAERWLLASESRHRLIIENANDGIWVLDAQGMTDFVNRRVCEMLGREPEELLGRSPSEFADAEGAAALAEASRLEGPRDYLELAFIHADGQPLWVALSASRYRSPSGKAEVHVLTDLTQRREIEARLRQAAERDRLTGAWNRGHFEALLSEELEQQEPGVSTALVFLNIDHFKYINDSLGHRAGDGLLQRVTQLFASTLRDGDELARLSGDEFAVLLRGADQQAAMQVAARLLEDLRSEHWRGTSSLSASAGVAVAGAARGKQPTAGDLLVAADIALHQAKQDGRNRQAVYTGEQGGFTWLEEIRSAIDDDRLVLHSQPIIPLNGGRHSEELLIRMIGRDGQLVSPAAFVPPAEQFGLIVDIDRWVVTQALQLAGAGRAVEVNLSAQSLGDEEIRRAVELAVANGVRPELLTFEITETAAARNLDDAREFSQALVELGCAFAIDDFGTGFGSLIYLRHLPIARVKIDVQFVSDMLSNPGDERVVSAIVSTARSLGQETVAEGVEDGATLQRLAEIGVDYAQGFHIQRPAPVQMAGLRSSSADRPRPT